MPTRRSGAFPSAMTRAAASRPPPASHGVMPLNSGCLSLQGWRGPPPTHRRHGPQQGSGAGDRALSPFYRTRSARKLMVWNGTAVPEDSIDFRCGFCRKRKRLFHYIHSAFDLTRASDILNPAGFQHLSGKSRETIWLRAGCPGHGGAGILPAASHAKTLMPFPPGSGWLSLPGGRNYVRRRAVGWPRRR